MGSVMSSYELLRERTASLHKERGRKTNFRRIGTSGTSKVGRRPEREEIRDNSSISRSMWVQSNESSLSPG
ncbi:hypothetical protein OIDMADRAFT_20633 [Oidiodendron maius Zn]|uniref:Uncharacterized protein n=1 Tax=Oidiodendron maius (strain Zn) TaxID=913774 RepID=A0A0C3H2E7_OIDMZ|nr:hypothetical protein OIDMADRAFT_20633 [Oidiodendron maius Zn]